MDIYDDRDKIRYRLRIWPKKELRYQLTANELEFLAGGLEDGRFYFSSICLTDLKLDDKRLTIIAKMLSRNNRIQRIDLSNNEINDEGLKIIVDALVARDRSDPDSIHNIISLTLSNNKITSKGAQYLADNIKKLNCENLILSHNLLCEGSFFSANEGVKNLVSKAWLDDSCESLNLKGSISDDCAHVILRSMRGMPETFNPDGITFKRSGNPSFQLFFDYPDLNIPPLVLHSDLDLPSPKLPKVAEVKAAQADAKEARVEVLTEDMTAKKIIGSEVSAVKIPLEQMQPIAILDPKPPKADESIVAEAVTKETKSEVIIEPKEAEPQTDLSKLAQFQSRLNVLESKTDAHEEKLKCVSTETLSKIEAQSDLLFNVIAKELQEDHSDADFAKIMSDQKLKAYYCMFLVLLRGTWQAAETIYSGYVENGYKTIADYISEYLTKATSHIPFFQLGLEVLQGGVEAACMAGSYALTGKSQIK